MYICTCITSACWDLILIIHAFLKPCTLIVFWQNMQIRSVYLVSMSMISFLRDGIWEMDSMILQAICLAERDDGVNMACCSQVVWVSFKWIGGVFHIFSLHLVPYFSIKYKALTSFLLSFFSDLFSVDSVAPISFKSNLLSIVLNTCTLTFSQNMHNI